LFVNIGDPNEFGLEYEPSFLKDDQNNKLNPDNQFNTRRSRYLPSGKQENFFNPTSIPSATQVNLTSAKGGWNQSPIKIAVGGPNIGGVGTGNPGIGSGKANYVPSFIGSGKGEKKSNFLLKYLKLLSFFLFHSKIKSKTKKK